MEQTTAKFPTATHGRKSESTNTIPSSANRVPRHTRNTVQERIRECTVSNIARSIASQEQIDSRLKKLDREWDTERTLELNASILAFSGVLLGRLVDRRWLYLSLGVTGFLAQHALQGWCPPLPVLRRLGFRTRKEIEQERSALKMVRGDFEQKPEYEDSLRQAEELLKIQEK